MRYLLTVLFLVITLLLWYGITVTGWTGTTLLLPVIIELAIASAMVRSWWRHARIAN